jgi:hypothetical protein
MPKIFLVCLPPGMGKTRLVLKEGILKRVPLNQKAWNNCLKRTVILIPNDGFARQAWLRELLLLAAEGRHPLVDHSENEIRAKKIQGLSNILKASGLIQPTFFTFGKLSNHRRHSLKCHGRWKCHYLVVDEWHHIWPKVGKHCEEYLNGGKAKPWYIGGRNIAKKIFFVSATPVNPTLEQEEENEDPYDDGEFAEKVKEAIGRTRKIIQGFVGKRGNIKGTKFFEIIDKLGVRKWPSKRRLKSRISWVVPKQANGDFEYFREQMLKSAEMQAIKTFLDQKLGYEEEYARMVGLVRTRYDRARKEYSLLRTKKGKRNCFGFPYSTLYFPQKGKTRNALKWLFDENTSIKRLINSLLSAGILEKHNGKLTLSKNKKKVLIFCTHRGVALGLTRTLRWFLKNEAKKLSDHFQQCLEEVDNIPPIAYDGESWRVSRDYTEKLINGFNGKRTNPVILIATDKLSESIDLHRSCKLLIHYELPWSPLRLFQRIGRLTRLKAWGKKTIFNTGVFVGHIIIPGSVAEERVNRVIRRISFLGEENLWPEGLSDSKLIMGLIGSGPSLHLKEYLMQAMR